MSSFGDLNRVNTNIQSLDSQLSLNRINKNLSENQLRLSTGLRINRAEDDAAGFSIATTLKSRVAGLEQALVNVGDAKSILDIAEASFDTIMDNLIEMKGLATQAANDSLGNTERGYIGEQIKALGDNINDVATQTVFQDFALLNGDGGTHTGSLELTFQVGERAADTLTTDLDAVNVNELFAGSSAVMSETNVTVTNGAFDVTHQTNAAQNVSVTVDGVTYIAEFDATGFTADDGASNGMLEAIASTVNGFGIDGFSAERVDGEITFTNTGSDAVSVTLLDTDNASVGHTPIAVGAAIAAAPGQGALDMSGWGADDFRGFIADIDSAIGAMSQRYNSIGITQSSLSVRESTLSQSISANTSAVSRIMDADFAKEQAESVRLQILQQTATSALAQANFSPQSVLGFLG